MTDALLRIENLSIAYPPYDASRQVLRNISLSVEPGMCLGLIGESGSGKSSVALSILHYLGSNGRYLDGQILFQGQDLLLLSRSSRRNIYGRLISHVAQDPMSALNPALRIEKQLGEAMALHLGLSREACRERSMNLLKEVRLRNPENILKSYPHQLSGGMQQRVCIAMAIACDPQLLILDEPTTGLDAVTESAILRLLGELKRTRNLAIIFISHNLAAVSGLSDRIAIMYGGMVVETGATADIFAKPTHRYTRMLLDAVPNLSNTQQQLIEIPWQEAERPSTGCPFRRRCDLAIESCADDPLPTTRFADGQVSRCVRSSEASLITPGRIGLSIGARAHAAMPSEEPILTVSNLVHEYGKTSFGGSSKPFRAVDDASFTLGPAQVIGVIGESGSGKSTLVRCIVGLVKPIKGSIVLGDKELSALRRYPRSVARDLQIVFQNIVGSLHPRKSIKRILSRPYQLYERREPVLEELQTLMSGVGLKAELLSKRAGALSGGEKQRTALARAYAPRPSVLVLDEAFSALDASMKVRVARLLLEKKAELQTSIIFVTHDLPFVPFIADRVIVMYRGWICESGKASSILKAPYHPYTETLVWSALQLEGKRPATLQVMGEDTEASAISMGCPFASRCPRKIGPICETEFPPEQMLDDGERIGCHIPAAALTRMQTLEYATSE